jgi:hypothetical protein
VALIYPKELKFAATDISGLREQLEDSELRYAIGRRVDDPEGFTVRGPAAIAKISSLPNDL